MAFCVSGSGVGMADKTIRSVCPYCGVGCGIVMQVADNKIIKVAGDKQHPTNFGRLCTKGSTCAQAVTESGRMEHAYLRSERSRDPVQIAMNAAISATAARLRAILDEHGPDAIALYVSGQMSLEAQYLANKLCKGFIGNNQIESNSRLCMASAGSGYKLSLGSDGPPGSYQDFDKADVFFVIGANMADCHPILFLRLMDRVKTGAKLIVVDPRRNATADKADLFLQIKPGTDLLLLNGLLHLLHKNGHTDPAFIAEFTEGWEVMPDFLEAYTPEHVAAQTGLDEAAIRQAAQWIGEAGEWMSCWTMGLNQSTHGTWPTKFTSKDVLGRLFLCLNPSNYGAYSSTTLHTLPIRATNSCIPNCIPSIPMLAFGIQKPSFGIQMCPQATRLSEVKLKASKPREKDYVLSDGNGLQLRVRVNSPPI